MGDADVANSGQRRVIAGFAVEPGNLVGMSPCRYPALWCLVASLMVLGVFGNLAPSLEGLTVGQLEKARLLYWILYGFSAIAAALGFSAGLAISGYAARRIIGASIGVLFGVAIPGADFVARCYGWDRSLVTLAAFVLGIALGTSLGLRSTTEYRA